MYKFHPTQAYKIPTRLNKWHVNLSNYLYRRPFLSWTSMFLFLPNRQFKMQLIIQFWRTPIDGRLASYLLQQRSLKHDRLKNFWANIISSWQKKAYFFFLYYQLDINNKCMFMKPTKQLLVVQDLLPRNLFNPLKPKLIQIILKNSVRTVKKTQHFTITKINRLTLLKEIIAVYSENHTESINIKCRVTSYWSRWDQAFLLGYEGLINTFHDDFFF
jgi:hypothetical protein